MKKIFLIFTTGVLAIGAMAQQWSGSTTTSGTISRNGIVQMLPDSSGVPYAELTPNHFVVKQNDIIYSKPILKQ